MKQGDFSQLAKAYIDRPSYGDLMCDSLLKLVELPHEGIVADVGAGTGKWTQQLAEKNCKIIAVEPCDEMRKEGMLYTKDCLNVTWKKGSAEESGLDTANVDWVTMASSFHWTDPQKSLPEFHRILKQFGCLTVLYNSRNLENFPLNKEIDAMIRDMVPGLKRVSSGLQNVKDWSCILVSTGHFRDAVFMECSHVEKMSMERYLNIWNSVNDIRAQAGEELWRMIMKKIREKVSSCKDEIMEVPYRIRSWTVRRVD